MNLWVSVFSHRSRGANFWCEFFERQPIPLEKVCESYFVTFERDQIDGIAIIVIKSGHKLHWALIFFAGFISGFLLESIHVLVYSFVNCKFNAM